MSETERELKYEVTSILLDVEVIKTQQVTLAEELAKLSILVARTANALEQYIKLTVDKE